MGGIVEVLIQSLIAIGIILMTYNVIRVLDFARRRQDMIVGKREKLLTGVVFALIVSFDITYVVIFMQSLNQLSIGLILSGGSVFVTVVIQWLFSLVRLMRRHEHRLAESLMAPVEARDPSLRGHSKHVQDLSLMIYDALPKEVRRTIDRESLVYAALFHDIGKLGVPESILNKPGPLTPEEWDVMKRHPVMGVSILDNVGSFRKISDWVLYHHERMDGHGYLGIPGDEIPLAARIISVADVFSALYMSRPYCGGVNYDECIRIMREDAGDHLDPELVDVFCSIPRERVLACSPSPSPSGERAGERTGQRAGGCGGEAESPREPSDRGAGDEGEKCAEQTGE
jgi:putative nucleotidyltransferase with HDIG domain